MPLEMAQARDKLQASAREIWSSIRSFDDVARKRDGESTQPTESANVMSLERIESVFKVMFGSCTTGGVPQASPEEDPTDSTKPFERRSRSVRSRDFVSGEHVYAQLFIDDQKVRATRAVDGLRERAASSPRARSASRLREPLPTRRSLPAALPTTKAVDISSDFSFDDGISAISAHTLDEMARIHDHKTTVYSKNTITPNRTSQVETITYHGSNRRNPGASIGNRPTSTKVTSTPLKFTRGRSSGTLGSKGTKSTKSSHDSEFASVWKKEERKYWDDVVQQQDKSKKTNALMGTPKQACSKNGRRRSRCGSLSVSSSKLYRHHVIPCRF